MLNCLRAGTLLLLAWLKRCSGTSFHFSTNGLTHAKSCLALELQNFVGTKWTPFIEHIKDQVHLILCNKKASWMSHVGLFVPICWKCTVQWLYYMVQQINNKTTRDQSHSFSFRLEYHVLNYIWSAILEIAEYVPIIEHTTPTVMIRMQVAIWKLEQEILWKRHYCRNFQIN